MKKRILSVFVAVVMLFTVIPLGSITANAITFNQLNASNVFLKQEGSTTCTLCATAMMMRRYSMLRGDSGWSSITESAIRSTAWINGSGLRWSFSYSNSSVSSISVGHYTLPGGSANEELIQEELRKCPEGIVIYNESTPHAVLLTDYTNGVYYCADPYGGVSSGRIPLSSSYTVRINNVTAYWKVTSPIVNGPTDDGGHTHDYSGVRVYEGEHPHVITQRCVDYATCGGYIVTGEYARVKTCRQCWYATINFSTSSVSLKVGESKTISVTVDGCWPDTAYLSLEYDESLIEATVGSQSITFEGLKNGSCIFELIIYSDSSKSHIIGSKAVMVTVSDPTYTGRVSFDKSSLSLVMPDNKTSTLNIELTGTWPEGAGYTFDYDSNVVSMTQNGTTLTITAQNAGSTNFIMNIVNKNNNNTLITSAVCHITVKNATYALNVNTSNTASISSAGEMKYYSFTPTTSGTYVIYSTGTSDTKVYLYNSNWTELDSDDDGGEDFNFRLEYNLTAGTEYIYGVRFYNSSTSGTLSFKFGNVYTITYNANGGSGAPSAQSKDYGTNTILSGTVPTKTGYAFLGWSTSSTATSAPYQGGSSFSSNANTTLYAVWKANTYTISYNANGGSGAPGNQAKTHGSSLILSSTKPTRPGYTFLGWATSSTATSASYQPGGSFTTNANATLYAVWKANTYTISYNANGGSGAPGNQTKTHGSSLTLSSTKPTRSGYSFLGWATSSTATSASYQPGGSFTTNADTTLYAVWKANTYTISYNANGGSGAPGNQTKTHGSSLILSSTKPTRTGYNFLGWATSASATAAQYSAGSVYKNDAAVTLYAVWEKIPATLSDISIAAKPSKTTYELGEDLDTSGLTLKLTYSDGSTKNITNGFTTSGFSSATTGTKTVTVAYGGKTTTFDVVVKPKVVDENTPQIIVENKTATAGETIEIGVSLKNNPGIAGLVISLKYDESVLTLVEAKNGGLLGGFSASKNYTWDEADNVCEDGLFVTFVFTVAENAEAGDYNVEAIIRSCLDIDLNDIELASPGGVVSVVDFVYGDSNGDQKVDMKDVVLLRKYIANFDYDTNTSSINVNTGADANGDGKIDMKDVVLLRKYIANYDYDTESSTIVLGPQL